MLALVTALILTGGSMEPPPPSRKVLGQKALDAHRTLQFEVLALRLVVDGKQVWRVEAYYPKEAGWSLSPNGASAAAWTNVSVDLYALADGASTDCALESVLTEGEQPGAALVRKGTWVGETAVEATLRTAKLWDGRVREVRVRCERGKVRRLTPTDDVPLAELLASLPGVTDVAQRQQRMAHVAWTARLRSNWSLPSTVGALVRIARDDEALRAQALLALQDQGGPGWDALEDFAGADARNDEAVLWALRSGGRWDDDAKRRVLGGVLQSKVDPVALQLQWFAFAGGTTGDLGEVAVIGAASPHAEVRAAVLHRLEGAVVSPGHLRAALKLLDLPGARDVVLEQLEGAAPRSVTPNLIAELQRGTVQGWPEGCLRIGEHLQASGESRLAGGLFVAGVVAAEASGDPLYGELLSRLALNLMARHERTEAHRVISILEGTTGAGVCALVPFDVEVGKLPKCPGHVSPGSEAAALSRMVP